MVAQYIINKYFFKDNVECPPQIRYSSLANINNDIDLGVDQLVAVVSKPLPARGRYGTDLRTVLAEMRLRQKVTQHKSDVVISINGDYSDAFSLFSPLIHSFLLIYILRQYLPLT